MLTSVACECPLFWSLIPQGQWSTNLKESKLVLLRTKGFKSASTQCANPKTHWSTVITLLGEWTPFFFLNRFYLWNAWVARRLSVCLRLRVCYPLRHWPTPSAQGVILESLDRVPHRAPCMEPASLSAFLSASHE